MSSLAIRGHGPRPRPECPVAANGTGNVQHTPHRARIGRGAATRPFRRGARGHAPIPPRAALRGVATPGRTPVCPQPARNLHFTQFLCELLHEMHEWSLGPRRLVRPGPDPVGPLHPSKIGSRGTTGRSVSCLQRNSRARIVGEVVLQRPLVHLTQCSRHGGPATARRRGGNGSATRRQRASTTSRQRASTTSRTRPALTHDGPRRPRFDPIKPPWTNSKGSPRRYSPSGVAAVDGRPANPGRPRAEDPQRP